MAVITSQNYVDFGTNMGMNTMYYGGNENGDWKDFASDISLQQYHRNVDHKYIRAWIRDLWYADSTFPLNSDGSYSWGNMDEMFDAVVAVGAKPIVLFAHGDVCGGSGESPAPFDFSNCEAFGTVPPSNFNTFADYVGIVTQHLVNRYSYSEVNTWYFEIMNEPFGFSNFNPDYYNLYNLAEPRIKAIVPNAKVGGYTYNGVAQALANCDYDFIDLHLYPNNLANIQNDQDRMDATTLIYDRIVSTKQEAGSVEVISGEYNIDVAVEPYNDGQREFYGSWMVSALINEIKAGADMEMVYQATCGYPGSAGCMGLWHTDGTTFDNYRKKKRFTEINPRGSTIYDDGTTNDFDILAVSNTDGNFITIVNMQNSNQNMDLQVTNINADELVNLETDEIHTITNELVDLNFAAYEVKFLQVQSDIVCNTAADTDCDGVVDRNELGTYGQRWINGLVTRTELGLAGQAWAGG